MAVCAVGGWYYGLSEKGREWARAIAGWLVILYLGAVIWGAGCNIVHDLQKPQVLGHRDPHTVNYLD